jgi:hypothetical protein
VPPRNAFACARRTGVAAASTWKGVDRLLRVTASQSSASALKMKPSRMIAALLTMMSMPPKHCTAKSTAASRATARSLPLSSMAVPLSAITTRAPLAVQPLDDGAADAAAATGDQRHAAVERAPHQKTTAAIANARFSASL